MTKKPRTFKTSVLDRRIKKFEEAVAEHAFIGAAHPDDHDRIEAEYKKARLELWNYILEFIL